MTDRGVTESVVEQAARAWLESLGYVVKHGFEIAPGEPEAERTDYGQVALERRMRDALMPKLPSGEIGAQADPRVVGVTA